MSYRLIASFLVFVLLWSGFPAESQAFAASEERPSASAQQAEDVPAVTDALPSVFGFGDPAGHDAPPADEETASAHAEGQADPPGLPQAGFDAHLPALAMTPPRPFAAAPPRAPYLEVPRRPPRPAGHSAA